jgi:hypothetical protein
MLMLYILMAWRILERELNFPEFFSFLVMFRSGSPLSLGNLRLQESDFIKNEYKNDLTKQC